MMPWGGSGAGFTLVEMMVGASILAMVIAALMGSFVGQTQLSAHARNLTAAMNDATRVLEQIRVQNVKGQGTCGGATPLPSVKPPDPYTSWNAWLNTGAPGAPKSIKQANRDAFELVVVTCQDQDGGTSVSDYCGPNQVGTAEWTPWYQAGSPTGGKQATDTAFDPIRVAVAVGWRQNRRAVGSPATGTEFTYDPGGAQLGKGNAVVTTSERLLVGPDENHNGVIDSQAMLTTLVSCR